MEMTGKWKQKSKKKSKGNAVLQKYMVAVDEFIKSKSGTEEAEDDRGLRFVKKKSRKELRREKRKMKKAKMKSYYEGKKTLDLPVGDGENSGVPADTQPQQQQKKKKIEKAKKELSKSSNAPTEKSDNSKAPTSSKKGKKGKKVNTLQESRKMALLEANEDEDREIKKLERCLGLNKRKNKKSLPQSFVADGLDYILGVLDSGSSAMGMYDDDDGMDVAKENFEKLDENHSPLSDEDEEPGDEMASDGSDEDMGSFDDESEEDEEEDDSDDEMIEEEKEEEEVMEDDQDELVESDAADSDNENEEETEDEADASDTKTSGSNSETVSSEIFVYYCHNIDILSEWI